MHSCKRLVFFTIRKKTLFSTLCEKLAKTDISSLSYGSLKFSGDAQYPRTNDWDLYLGPGGPIFRQGGPKIKKSKKFKPYQVDTFRKGKIERNTIKQVSD